MKLAQRAMVLQVHPESCDLQHFSFFFVTLKSMLADDTLILVDLAGWCRGHFSFLLHCLFINMRFSRIKMAKKAVILLCVGRVP